MAYEFACVPHERVAAIGVGQREQRTLQQADQVASAASASAASQINGQHRKRREYRHSRNALACRVMQVVGSCDNDEVDTVENGETLS